MKVKPERTVALKLHPAIEHAMNVVDRVWYKVTGKRPVITGLQETGHSSGSRHYGILGDIRCRAFDVRISELNADQKYDISDALVARLGAGLEFDVVWESNHLHVEYDPK